ncbi:hypothetical protein [Citrobacter portucalensis]|uniref:hypothetical protein n=2 Tax=Citrobacter portucalensis TaxID=1639133 RepID=UPI0028BEE5F3|nr:hypothetical protein [Citrobacter portucalensis]MDT7482869.1 hypothetical protein [Citrobacter portucalensis]WOU44309.1 hypothetical protein R4T15_23055 [Citrobacter portucalensis]
MEAQDIALYPMVRCCDVPDALRLSGLQNTFSPAPVGRIRRHVASGGFHPAQTQKSPSVRMGFFTLFDAWQFMAGVLPATLRAVAAQRSNPLPADLSWAGERSPTDNR